MDSPIKKEVIIGECRLLLGDCREILPLVGKVDAVVTSPPYNLKNATKGTFYMGKNKGLSISYATYSDDMSDEDYESWQHLLFKLWFEMLNESGVIAYNHKPRIENGIFDSRRNLIPFDIRQEIIWDRCCMVNFAGTFFAPQTERVFLVSKADWRPNREFVGLGDVWRIPPEINTPHPAPFPLALAERIIKGCSPVQGDVIDPFMGSGTTGVACAKSDRKFIGIELDETYFDIACERISKAYAQPDLFLAPPAPKAVQEVML